MRKFGCVIAVICLAVMTACCAAAEPVLPGYVTAQQEQTEIRTETSRLGGSVVLLVGTDTLLQVIGYSYDMQGNLWWRMVDYRTGKDGYGIADSFAEVTDEEAQLRKVQIDTATPTPTPTSTPTPTPMPTPTPTATPTHTPTPTPVSTTIPTPVPSREPTASPTPCLVLADTNEVYVEFRGIVPDDHGDIVNLYIENKRDESIWVSLSSVSINSKKIIIYNGLVSVAAGSKYQAAPSYHFLISREQYEQHGIASTDELEFDLLVYDGKVLSEVVFNMRAKLNLKVESLAAIEPTATPAPIQNVKIEGYPYVGWTLKAANVRKSPSSKADRVGETKKGEEVAVLGEKTDSNGTIWYEVSSLFGGKGYVRSDLIQVQKEADVSAIYHQADPAPVTESAPISLSFEEIRTAFKQNMDDTPAWNIQEITQVDENCWMFEAVYSSDPNKNRMQVYYRITENGQIVIGARTNADAAGSYEELLKTAKRIHDGGDYGWYLTDADFDYNSLANLCSRLLKVFTSDFDFGLVGEKEYNFFERAIAIGYEDNFAYGFDSDHFADGYGDHFTRVGDYEICFAIRDMQLELAIRKRKSGPGAGKANSVSILELETYSSEPKDEYPKTGTITGSNVNIRQEPDTGSKRIAKYQHGTIVTVLGEEKRGEYTWYRIVVSGGDSGYVRGDLLEFASGQKTAIADSTSTANAGKQSTTKKSNSSTGSTTKKSTSSSKAKSCSTCGGDGKVTSTCSSCGGSGKKTVECYNCAGYGVRGCGACGRTGYTKCSRCGGSGNSGTRRNPKVCYECDGAGMFLCGRCYGSGYDECRICNEKGVRKTDCSKCGGDGKITKNCLSCR